MFFTLKTDFYYWNQRLLMISSQYDLHEDFIYRFVSHFDFVMNRLHLDQLFAYYDVFQGFIPTFFFIYRLLNHPKLLMLVLLSLLFFKLTFYLLFCIFLNSIYIWICIFFIFNFLYCIFLFRIFSKGFQSVLLNILPKPISFFISTN